MLAYPDIGRQDVDAYYLLDPALARLREGTGESSVSAYYSMCSLRALSSESLAGTGVQ